MYVVCAFLWELLLVWYAMCVRYIGKTVLTVVEVDGSIYLAPKSTCPFPLNIHILSHSLPLFKALVQSENWVTRQKGYRVACKANGKGNGCSVE